MIPDGKYTAVVDRIENGVAAMVIEKDGTDTAELLVKPATLPDTSQYADAVLTIELRNGELVEAIERPSKTENRAKSAQRRFDQLSEQPPRDDDT